MDCPHAAAQPILAQRGFVTIATGAEKYYQMARSLLHSYKLNGGSALPFALICDRDCDIAREFDHTVIIPNPHNSFLDKLSLADTTPYQETIFIDADSLIMQDLNPLWDDFQDEDDVSCYGTALPLHSDKGWFYYEGMGDLQSRLKFNVSMHGGIYYLRRTPRCRAIFHQAIDLAQHYSDYAFYYFTKPADEPVLALSMALAGCKPCAMTSRVTFYITHKEKIRVSASGKLSLHGAPCTPCILHFGARNIPRFVYQYSASLIERRTEDSHYLPRFGAYLTVCLRCLPFEIKYRAKKILKKLLPQKVIRALKRKK